METRGPKSPRSSRNLTIVAVVALLVVGGGYLAYSYTGTGTAASTSGASESSGTGTSTTGDGTISLLSLFGTYSGMTYSSESYDLTEGSRMLVEQHNFTYTVLAPGSLNSTEYTKVQFAEAGTSHVLIVWFNPQGGVDRADVLGAANYTGSQAQFFASEYVSLLSTSVAISANSSLLPPLTEVSQGVTSLGSTQLQSTTYQLAGSSSSYSNVTAKFATIPGTGARLLVYLDQVVPADSETTFQVLSVTK